MKNSGIGKRDGSDFQVFKKNWKSVPARFAYFLFRIILIECFAVYNF